LDDAIAVRIPGVEPLSPPPLAATLEVFVCGYSAIAIVVQTFKFGEPTGPFFGVHGAVTIAIQFGKRSSIDVVQLVGREYAVAVAVKAVKDGAVVGPLIPFHDAALILVETVRAASRIVSAALSITPFVVSALTASTSRHLISRENAVTVSIQLTERSRIPTPFTARDRTV
jgi:hypothetical protein